MTPAGLLFLGLFGLVIGSFLNVVIYRLPRHIPLAFGRSGCPHCGALISWWQNLPVFSYLVLGGRCHTCKGRISLRYPLVELLTAVTFAAWIADPQGLKPGNAMPMTPLSPDELRSVSAYLAGLR